MALPLRMSLGIMAGIFLVCFIAIIINQNLVMKKVEDFSHKQFKACQLDDLMKRGDSLDLVFTSCKTWHQNIIHRFTGSRWTHVGMLYRNHADNKLFVIEISASDCYEKLDGKPRGKCLTQETFENWVWIRRQLKDTNILWIPRKNGFHYRTDLVECCYDHAGSKKNNDSESNGNSIIKDDLKWKKDARLAADSSNSCRGHDSIECRGHDSELSDDTHELRYKLQVLVKQYHDKIQLVRDHRFFKSINKRGYNQERDETLPDKITCAHWCAYVLQQLGLLKKRFGPAFYSPTDLVVSQDYKGKDYLVPFVVAI